MPDVDPMCDARHHTSDGNKIRNPSSPRARIPIVSIVVPFLV